MSRVVQTSLCALSTVCQYVTISIDNTNGADFFTFVPLGDETDSYVVVFLQREHYI